MEQQELIALLQQPTALTEKQTVALKEVLAEYPYFQAARALLLKGLKNQSSLHYNNELKVTAAYTLDRGVLFDYITSAEFNQNEVSKKIKQNAQTASSQPDPQTASVVRLNEALRVKLKESEQVFDPALFSPYRPGWDAKHSPVSDTEDLRTEETGSPEQEHKGQTEHSDSEDSQHSANTVTDTENGSKNIMAEESRQETLNLGRPLSFQKDENHSFSEWLRLTQAKPVNRQEESNQKPDSQSRKFKLIDQFISKSPRIIPSKSAPKPKLVEMEQSAPEALMTETLARVYLEQKNYKKAIQAYKILILKNPEKSGFFADQIRAITKLQEQNS